MTTSTTEAPEASETPGELTSGPDERETRTPPGSPKLSPSGRWPTYRFDAANTGYNSSGRGLRDADHHWRLRPAGSASVADGTLFTLSGDSEHTSLARSDPATAATRTRTRLVQYGTNSPPTVVGDRVYVTSFIEVFCLAADRDELLWRGPEMDGIQGVPTVSDGTVYVNTGGFRSVSPHLRAFDAETGEQQWRYDTDSESKSTPAVADDRVFVNSRDGLHAVDATDGSTLFTVGDAADEWGTPAVGGDTVYAMAYRDGADELLAIDAADGSVRWRKSAGAMRSVPPVVTPNAVYVGTDAGVVAVDPTDGRETLTLGGSGEPVARVGDVLYTVQRGTISALDAAGEGELWSYETEDVQVHDTVGQTIYGVTPVDDAVYVSARDGFHGIGPSES
ncbi:PQQ-binding-like beta-propeller repeat protein [Haloprofundus marisrubri]|uniref:PQQ-binding-like beta-propeller repeat protein n=1 Tax=Haloprofundus marisrubri TaxID=1514971 RepID=UPI00196A01E1|nr:PQQ-binding-like beta-propeller repeat protein [Haloprofundus marisrubri]